MAIIYCAVGTISNISCSSCVSLLEYRIQFWRFFSYVGKNRACQKHALFAVTAALDLEENPNRTCGCKQEKA